MNIRPGQMKTFEAASLKGFEDRMAVHLQIFFPDQVKALGGEKVREAVRHALERASQYGINTERDVCRFTGVMFTLGSDFDTNPAHAWAAEILSDPSIETGTARLDRLFKQALKNINEAAVEEEKKVTL